MTRIGWAAGAAYLDDPDLQHLHRAADANGLDSETVVWDDPDVDWGGFDAVVVRSCWDYVPRREEFLDWSGRVPHLLNDAATIVWNTDKHYLRELEAAGVRIVPTAWSVQDVDGLPAADEWVVKPTVSAGAADTARWRDAAAAVEHGRRLLAAGRATMTQPYVASVDSDGETGLLFFGGRFSHAFRKGALLADGEDPRTLPELKEDIRAREASPEQVAFGADVLDAASSLLPRVPLYARVDIVRAPDGTWQLMELELTEPSFFLQHTDTGADAFVKALLERLEA